MGKRVCLCHPGEGRVPDVAHRVVDRLVEPTDERNGGRGPRVARMSTDRQEDGSHRHQEREREEPKHPGIVGGEGAGDVLGAEKVGDKYGHREDEGDTGSRGVVDGLLAILRVDPLGRDS